VNLRVLRFAVLSSVVLWVSPALAQEAPPRTAAQGPATVTSPRLSRSEPAIVPDKETPTEAVSVILELTVDETAHTRESAIVESGGARVDQCALDAVKRLELEPARRAVVALAAKIRYRYVFCHSEIDP
jgi:hypothetical protein